MKRSDMPGVLSGLSVGAMLSAALIAVLYAGWRVAGLAFVPFDVFDWVSRVLPGPVLAFGISTMVAVIRALQVGATSVVAKTAEQAMGIAGLFFTGAIGGALVFGVLRVLRGRHAYLLGLILGAVVGVPALLISVFRGQTASVSPALSALWILTLFLGWGACFGWAYRRLTGAAPVEEKVAELPGEELYSVERVNRRQFLIRLAGATATITVAGAIVGELSSRSAGRRKMAAVARRWSATHALPNANASVKPAPGTRAEFTSLEKHYRIDINTFPPSVDERSWRLKVTGLVEKPLALTLEQLRGYLPTDLFVTLSCISNPVGGDLTGTTRWTGVSLQRLLPDLGLKPGATHLMIRAADGFYEVVPLETVRKDPHVMLTYAWDGIPLEVEHGFPLRIYIPDRYGMKQPKWIESIEAIDHWEAGFWVARGWDKEARMKATSVIDTVATGSALAGGSGQKLIPVGGIAHAGARGISKVEVQVDGGSWHEAALRTSLSQMTWVIWRYDLPFEPGEHKLTVRCFDGQGAAQITTPAPPEPSGATGLDSKTRNFA